VCPGIGLRRFRFFAPVALVAALLALLCGSSSLLAAQTLHLPYPGGLAVEIIEGYNGGTHNGVERYSLDLVRADGATSGSPVVAPASGSVAFAETPGSEHGCIGVAMDNSGDFHYMLCHIILNRTYGYGDRIQQGQLLGTVGAPGLVGNNGTAHIHMQLYTLPGGVRTPAPFSPPDGIPLEGVAMPADGSFNQWACAGAACKGFASQNAGAVLSAATSAPAPVSPLPPPTLPPLPSGSAATGGALAAGQTAVVQGTGDCLRAHAQPDLGAATTGCAVDGTLVTIVGGPVQAGGAIWWQLYGLGWSVADYLRTSSASVPSALDPLGAGLPPVPAVSTPTTASSTSPASAASPQPQFGVGALAEVSGSGDCLKVHAEPSLAAAAVGCLTDGTLSAVHDGPRTADGHTWWLLDGGWAVADYLQAVPY
jgi:hypothetical protein